MTYKPGAQYRVQIDTVMTATMVGGCLRAPGVTLAPEHLEALLATVTEIAPPEPPLGSVYRACHPGGDIAFLIERAFAGRGPGWWNHATRSQMTWDEVRDLPGGLIYDASTTDDAS